MFSRKQRYILTILIIITSTLMGCANHQNSRVTRNTVTGAVVGGVAGGVVGAAVDTSVPGAAAVGAVVGGVIGYKAKPSSRAAIRRLQQEGVQVLQLGDTVKVVLPTDKFFEVGSAELLSEQNRALDEVGSLLLSYEDVPIAIEGYTDDILSPKHGVELSARQAQRIASYMWSHGVAESRMHVVGYGKGGAIASNRYAEGSGMNRRVEVTFKTIT